MMSLRPLWHIWHVLPAWKIPKSNLNPGPCCASTVRQQLELIHSCYKPDFPFPVAALRHKFGATHKWVYFWLNLQDEGAQTLGCPALMCRTCFPAVFYLCVLQFAAFILEIIFLFITSLSCCCCFFCLYFFSISAWWQKLQSKHLIKICLLLPWAMHKSCFWHPLLGSAAGQQLGSYGRSSPRMSDHHRGAARYLTDVLLPETFQGSEIYKHVFF